MQDEKLIQELCGIAKRVNEIDANLNYGIAGISTNELKIHFLEDVFTRMIPQDAVFAVRTVKGTLKYRISAMINGVEFFCLSNKGNIYE